MIYISLLGIPMVLLVVHMLLVLSKPSIESQRTAVQTSVRRSG